MTNGDKIRRMTDRDLAAMFTAIAAGELDDKICRDCSALYGPCPAKETEQEKCRYSGLDAYVKWLGQEVQTWR